MQKHDIIILMVNTNLHYLMVIIMVNKYANSSCFEIFSLFIFLNFVNNFNKTSHNLDIISLIEIEVCL